MHGDGVSSNKESSEINSVQVMQFGVKAGQLSDVIAYHVQ